MQKMNQVKNELKQCTGSPSLNLKSVQTMNQQGNIIKDRLENQRAKQQISHLLDIAEIDEKIMQNCTFSPKIDIVYIPYLRFYYKLYCLFYFYFFSKFRSKELGTALKENRKEQHVYNHLYSLHLEKQKKQYTFFSKQNQFHDSQFASPKNNTENSNKFKHTTATQFLQRMETDIKLKNQQKYLLEKHSQNYDIFTGEELFSPKLQSNKFNELVKQNKKKFKSLKFSQTLLQLRSGDVFSNLYQQAIEKQDYQQEIEQQIDHTIQKNSNVKLMQKSTQIVENQRIEILQDIFRKIDTDQDGFISNQKIDITVLEKPIISILLPVFKELEMADTEIDFDDFKTIALHHLKQIPINDKADLLKLYKNKFSSPQKTYFSQIF